MSNKKKSNKKGAGFDQDLDNLFSKSKASPVEGPISDVQSVEPTSAKVKVASEEVHKKNDLETSVSHSESDSDPSSDSASNSESDSDSDSDSISAEDTQIEVQNEGSSNEKKNDESSSSESGEDSSCEDEGTERTASQPSGDQEEAMDPTTTSDNKEVNPERQRKRLEKEKLTRTVFVSNVPVTVQEKVAFCIAANFGQ
jgi:hypothetical protein